MTLGREIRLLVVGRDGQVGRELMRAALLPNMTVAGVGRETLDVKCADAVRRLFEEAACDLVVNAAAYTQVDRAEDEREEAFAVNRDGPANLADACRARGLPLLHISTDYVFDGTKVAPYAETDPVNPLGAYGASKEAGERAVRERLDRHIVLRTAWVFSPFRHNFVKTMLRLGREREQIGVVDDQTGCPTAAADIAAAIVAIAGQLTDDRFRGWGTYHFCGSGRTTWYGFARAIFETAARHGRKAPQVKPITTADYPTPARRPMNSVLDCSRITDTFGIRPRPWRDSLDDCIAELLGPRGGDGS